MTTVRDISLKRDAAATTAAKALALACVLALAWAVAACVAPTSPAFATELHEAADDSVPETITVQFRQGIGVIGGVPEATPDMTINDTFAATDAQRPQTDDEQTMFKGWAASASATTALPGYLTLADAYRQAGIGGTLLLYPVFGAAEKPHVTFYGQDRTTVLAQATIEPWQSIDQASAAPDFDMKDASTRAPALRKLGHWFVGWTDADGVICAIDQPLAESVSLYPKYQKIRTEFLRLKKASADVSKAFLLQSGLEKALSTSFTLEKASGVDTKLTAAAVSDGFTVMDCFQATFGYLDTEEETIVREGFGLVTMTLPTSLADGANVKLYWLKANGTVGHSVVKQVEGGAVKLGFADYKISYAGNIALAYKAKAVAPGDRTRDDSSKGDGSSGSSSSSSSSSGSKSTGDKGASSGSETADGSGQTAGQATVASSASDDDDDDSNWGGSAAAAGTSSRFNSGKNASTRSSAKGDSDEPDETVLSNSPSAKSKKKSAASDDEDEDSLADNALTSAAASAVQRGSKDGGVVYGITMLLIAAAAVLAWWLVFLRTKRRPPAPDTAQTASADPQSAPDAKSAPRDTQSAPEGA